MIPNCKRIFLCTPAREKVTVLNSIQTDTVDLHVLAKGYSELSFEVDRYLSIDGEFVEANGYEDLKPYMYLYLEDIGYFQMQAPSVNNDGNRETKSVVAYSAEKEFENKDWQGIKINTGEDTSYERLVDNNIDSLGRTINYITMVNESNYELSFLHLILEKVSQWNIGYISPQLKIAKIPSLDIDNENLYAVMTSEVGPRLSCIFIFDYLNFKINVYHKDDIEFDTGIFIGFRNLAQNIDYSVNDDSIYTRFSVMGDEELTFESYNYGDNQAFDLSYFLGEPYMDDELAEKIQAWIDFRNNHRQEYVALTKQYDKINSALTTLRYRVPADEDYWKNWDDLNLEGDNGLLAQRDTFNATLKFLQVQVDDRDASEKYDANENYLPKLDENGEVDHEWYLEKLYDNIDNYGGYYTYLDIVTYILPYIEIAISNYGKPDYQKVTPETDASEDWSLYGYVELDAVRKSYEEDLITRLAKYEKEWDDMDQDEKDAKALNYKNKEGYDNSPGRVEYLKYLNALGDPEGLDEGTIYYYLKILERQIADYQAQLSEILEKIDEYNNLARYNVTSAEVAAMTTVPSATINDRTLFSEDEIALITTLFHDTDYENTNIWISQYQTFDEKLLTKKELYDDAMDKLFEVAQPQYTFSVSLDNFMRLAGYEAWGGEFNINFFEDNRRFIVDEDAPTNGLLKFVRLGIRDNYSVKLRVIGYRWNPCEVTPDLQLEFSNMIVSKSGRTDFTELLDTENNRGAKNSISIGLGNSNHDQEYIQRLLEIITNSAAFSNGVASIASGVIGATDGVYVGNLITDYLNSYHIEADSVNAKNITGDQGDFNELFTEYLGANIIVSQLVSADEGIIDDLVSEVITVGKDGLTKLTKDTIKTVNIEGKQITVDEALVNDVLKIGEEGITTLSRNQITTQNVVAELVKADEGAFSTLTSETGFIKYLNSGVIETQTISADTVIAALVDAEVGDFDELKANEAFIQMLNSGIINAQKITGDQIIAGLVDTENPTNYSLLADSAFIEYLNSNLVVAHAVQADEIEAALAKVDILHSEQITADSAFFRTLQSLSSSTATSVIDESYIQSAIINKLAVADLAAGDITLTNNMRIVSDNGLMLMDGQNLQIMGVDTQGNPYVGVQLGYATNGQPTLILRNENNATIVDANGITSDAIADQLIVNNMIKAGTISKDRLGFNVMESGDSIDIEQIYLNGGQFGVQYTSFKNDTESALSNLGNLIDGVSNSVDNIKQYDLYIEAPNGLNIRGRSITLNAKLFENNVDVTDIWGNQYFTWTRTSDDAAGDTAWNADHAIGTKSITLTSADVTVNASFQCKFEYNNTVVTS